MNYKTGETPQVNDEVLGQVNGAPARGRVLGMRGDKVVITRRAPYQGASKPLASIHDEVDASALSLVYRPLRPDVGAPTPAPKAAPRQVEAKAKGSKKEAAAK